LLEEVASMIGVDPRTVSRLELGQMRPTLEHVVSLARALASEGTSQRVLESEFLRLGGDHVRYRLTGQKLGVVSRRQVDAVLRRARARRRTF